MGLELHQMTDRVCKRCEHICHCNTNDEHKIITNCGCVECNCPDNNVWNYEEPKVANKFKAEDLSFENNGVVVDDTENCDGCQ